MKNTSWVVWVLVVMFAVGSTISLSGCKKQQDPAEPRSLQNDGDGEED